MKMNFRLGDAAAPFAHLLGMGRRADSSARGLNARAESDDDDDKEDKDKEARRAEDDKDKPDAESDKPKDDGETDDGEDVEDDDKRDGRKGKKGKRAEDDKEKEKDDDDKDAGVDGEDDDSDEEMRGNSAAAQARRRERARCESIFACKAAMERPDVAAQLAFRTTMPRAEAIGVLIATAAGQSVRGSRLADRMAAEKPPHIGPEAEANKPANLTPVAAAIIAAGERARTR